MHHPDAWLGAPVEATVFDPDNPYVLGPHLAAAAQELPLTEADLALFGPRAREGVDALEAAGGAQRGVDLTPLNLARVLVDGEQILVGVDPPAAAVAGPGTGGTGGPGVAVNLNTATLEELDALPGVGPVTAQAILDWRTENGRFTSVDDLLDVAGIGEKTLEDLRDRVSV